MGRRACACSTTTSPASGSATATTTAATRGSSSATKVTELARDRGRPAPSAVADARWSSTITAETDAREDVPPRARAPVAASRRPALRRAAHRARRLHRVAFVLGRVGARRLERDRAHRRAPRRRRGLDVPARRGRDRRRARGARPDRRLVRVERRHARAARRRRLGHRAAHGDAAAARASSGSRSRAPRRVGALARRSLLRGRARSARRRPSSTRAPRPPATRAAPGRLDARRSSPLLDRAGHDRVRVRSSGFADAASHLLVDLGVPVHQVRVERFGPTS